MAASRSEWLKLYHWVRNLYLNHLTEKGRTLFWILVLSAMAGSLSLIIKIYFVFCILSSLFLVSMVLARLAQVPLTIHSEFPERSTCGIPFVVPVIVRNKTLKRAYDVAIRPHLPKEARSSPDSGYWPHISSEAEEKVQFKMEFLRRGYYELPSFQQETLFPLGLWKSILFHKNLRGLFVYPRFHQLRSLDIPIGKRYQPGGIALTSHLGESTEFISTREFRPGDSLRAIHWRSWARVGVPIVKEFQEEYFCRIALVLDTFVPAQSGERYRNEFEAAISISAAIADCLSREEYVVDIFAAGPEIYYLQAGRSLAYLENVLDILACIEPCKETAFEKITPVLLEHLGSVTTTIVILLDWDERRKELIQTILDQGSAVKVVLVRDTPPTLDTSGSESLTGPIVSLSSWDERNGVEEL